MWEIYPLACILIWFLFAFISIALRLPEAHDVPESVRSLAESSAEGRGLTVLPGGRQAGNPD